MEPCKYEHAIGVIEQSLKDIKNDTDSIKKVLNGNGTDGVVTRISLNQQSLKRLWWFVSISMATFISGTIGLWFWMVKNIAA
jgi:hypothetical protein